MPSIPETSELRRKRERTSRDFVGPFSVRLSESQIYKSSIFANEIHEANDEIELDEEVEGEGGEQDRSDAAKDDAPDGN